jgi:hypothetical protein
VVFKALLAAGIFFVLVDHAACNVGQPFKGESRDERRRAFISLKSAMRGASPHGVPRRVHSRGLHGEGMALSAKAHRR